MTQINTPYPATAYLKGFLRAQKEVLGLEVTQTDPALEMVLGILSRTGIPTEWPLCQDFAERGRAFPAFNDMA